MQAQITDPMIYTTGSFLRPMRVPSDNSETGWLWRWVVTEFEADSFLDGNTYNPAESAYTKEELLINTTPDSQDYCYRCRKLGETTCPGTRSGCWES